MNKVIIIGRLTKDPDVRDSGSSKVGRYTLAVDRKFKQDNSPTADFIPCVVFGKSAEFAEKYLRKGTKMAIIGRIQTGSYKNKDGQTVYTTDVVVEEQEFAESKGSNSNASSGNGSGQVSQQKDDFMNIPNAIDEEVPFA